MKQGINLATRPLRSRRWLLAINGILVLAALVATAVHLAVAIRTDRMLVELTEELDRLEDRRGKLSAQLEASRERVRSPSARRVIRELVAIDKSGITRAVPPAQILSELARVMPDDAKTLSVDIKFSPPEQTLRLEVLSDSTEAAKLLLEGLSQSPLVIEAAILDERHRNDGGIYLRVGASWALPGVTQ